MASAPPTTNRLSSKAMPKIAPASWRGVQFGVLASSAGGGRQLAVHQYPGKEVIWSEDIGQGPGRYTIHGFVVDADLKLSGASIAAQRASLFAAFRQKGPGALVHPTLGTLDVSLARWSVSEGLDASNYSEFDLEFIDAGEQTFPTVTPSNTPAQAQSGIAAFKRFNTLNPSAADKLRMALQKDAIFALQKLATGQSISALTLLGMGTGLLGLAGVRADLVAQIAGWTAKAILLAKDATSLLRLTAGLPGNYGRFAAGGNTGLTGSNPTAYSSSTTVQDLISTASTQRVAVAEAAATFQSVAQTDDLTNAVDLQAAASALMATLVASCADPADAIRLLLQLIAYTIDGLPSQTDFVVSQLVIRAAAAALVDASATYQPSSANDAAARIAQICPVLDALSITASNVGDDDSFAALSDCRGVVATDLRTRGATLAQVTTFDRTAQLPALALAQMLYGDPTRADQLIAQADPDNPLFFPGSFQALAA